MYAPKNFLVSVSSLIDPTCCLRDAEPEAASSSILITPYLRRMMNFRVRLMISPLVYESELACMDGSARKIALVAAVVRGFTVENAVTSMDNAAIRMLGS